jgi:hypothetical protein
MSIKARPAHSQTTLDQPQTEQTSCALSANLSLKPCP